MTTIRQVHFHHLTCTWLLSVSLVVCLIWQVIHAYKCNFLSFFRWSVWNYVYVLLCCSTGYMTLESNKTDFYTVKLFVACFYGLKCLCEAESAQLLRCSWVFYLSCVDSVPCTIAEMQFIWAMAVLNLDFSIMFTLWVIWKQYSKLGMHDMIGIGR